jgi:hypothetical protein
MKQLHEGLDYKLYKIYVWSGLPLYFIYVLVSTQVFDTLSLPGPTAYIVNAGPLLLWFAGILLYWWWVFLFKGNKELNQLVEMHRDDLPGIEALKSWNTLHQAMAISGGNVEELIKKAKRANRPMIYWFGIMNLMAIWVCGFVTLGSLEIIKTNDVRLLLYGVLACVAIMLISLPFLWGWGGKTAEDAYLAPLGLAVTREPGLKPDAIGFIGGGQKLIPDGAAIVEGERHGRLVHIETIDRYSLTVLKTKMPKFSLLSKEGELKPNENAPAGVADELKSLRKAKRWQGIEVHSGPEGIAIQRKSKGTNMWLYDLWLAEYLSDKIRVR